MISLEKDKKEDHYHYYLHLYLWSRRSLKKDKKEDHYHYNLHLYLWSRSLTRANQAAHTVTRAITETKDHFASWGFFKCLFFLYVYSHLQLRPSEFVDSICYTARMLTQGNFCVGTEKQRPKKSELSGRQLSTRKNFPDKVRKSFLPQKKRVNRFRDKKVCINCFGNKTSELVSFLQQKSVG